MKICHLHAHYNVLEFAHNFPPLQGVPTNFDGAMTSMDGSYTFFFIYKVRERHFKDWRENIILVPCSLCVSGISRSNDEYLTT